MSDSPFNFAPLGDQRDHHEHYTAGPDPVWGNIPESDRF